MASCKDEMFPCESRVSTTEYRNNYDSIFNGNSAAVILPEITTRDEGVPYKRLGEVLDELDD